MKDRRDTPYQMKHDEKDFGPNLATQCPTCGRYLQRYSTTSIRELGNSCLGTTAMGHCPKCGKLYSWREQFRIYLQTEPKEINRFGG